MDFLPQPITDYSEAHTEEENALLKKIVRETHLKVLMPRMLSGHLQGRVLSMLSHMIKPKNILEIGTYTGYSGLCLAEGLQKEGKLITLDINEELEELVQGFFDESEFKEQIDYKIGNALEIIPTLNETFDLVFIDADKINYINYFNLVIDKVTTGGYIIADNVLWSGKIIPQEGKKIDTDTQALLDFNLSVHKDPSVQNVLLPIRDGLMILRKL